MASIVVVFPKIENAKSVKNLLVRSGFTVNAVCTTGAQTLEMIDGLGSGIIVSAYRLPDMTFRQLSENLPEDFELLLIASQANLKEAASESGIVALSMPLQVNDLINTVDMMCSNIDRRRRKKREQPRQRNLEELETISKAKHLLMERNHMTEDEAHKYMQKCSMDSSTNMVETAHMILDLLK